MSSGGLYAHTFSLYFYAIFSSAAGLLFLPLILRYLTTEEVGVYTGFFLVTGVSATIFSLSIPAMIYQILPRLVKKTDEYGAFSLIKKSFLFAITMGIIALTVILVLSTYISEYLFKSNAYTDIVILAAIDVPFEVALTFTNAYLFGLGKIRKQVIIAFTTTAIKYGLGAVLLISGFSLGGIILAIVIGDAFALLVSMLFLFRTVNRKSKKETDVEYGLRKLIILSGPLYANSIVNFFSGTIERFVILFAANPAVLGVYSVAMVSIAPIRMIASSINKITVLDFSSFNEPREAYARAKTVSNYLIIISVPMGFLVAALAEPLITVIGGAGYSEAILPFMILGITYSVTIWLDTVGRSLSQTSGKSRQILYSNIIAICSGLVLGLVLIPHLSVLGAALARAGTQILAFVVLLLFIRIPNIQLIDPKVLSKVISAAGVASIFVYYAYDFLGGTYFFPLYGALGFLIYLLIIRLTSVVKSNDLAVFEENVPKQLRPLVKIFGSLAVRTGS